MANQGPNYCPGRGLSPNLFCRYNNDSIDYSDGASGIFLSSIATACTKGANSSSISIDTCSVSSTCAQSAIITDSYATLNI